MLDKILLIGIEVQGRHGCSEEERRTPQPFIIDAELYLDLSRSSHTDDLADTIDYAAVINDIKHIVEGTSRNLLESVAQDICNILFTKYLLLKRVKLIVYKTESPLKDILTGGAAVEITRSRMK
ncbi:MAG: dihydroneopterin aldolase [Selenomonadaceae bacterium]|nr:dihydroneopterin aldolase [Selenomonadaceae bacterium]